MKSKIPPITSSVAIATSNRPMIFVKSMIPPGPSRRERISEKCIVAHMTKCATATAHTKPIQEAMELFACATDTITAAIAPH